MQRIKKFLCNENPGILAMYTIVALLVIAEFVLMGWHFLLVVVGGVVLGAICVAVGYGLMLIIKRLQLKCVADEDV